MLGPGLSILDWSASSDNDSGSAAAKMRCVVGGAPGRGVSYRFLGPAEITGGAGRFSPCSFFLSASFAIASHSGFALSFCRT